MDESEKNTQPDHSPASTDAESDAQHDATDEVASGDQPPAAVVMRRLGVAAWLGVLWALLPALGGFILLARIAPASDWLRSFGDNATLVYIAAFTVTAGFGLLPTYAQAFVAGWAFGFVPGTLAALGGFVGASIVGRFVAKSLVRGKVNAEIDRHEKAAAVRDTLVRSGPLKTLGIVTLVRIPPNSPFALTNGVLATTGVPLWSYVLGTAVGMLPRTAAVVWLGAQFEGVLSKDALNDAKPGWWIPVALGVAVAVFFVLYQIGQKAIRRVTEA